MSTGDADSRRDTYLKKTYVKFLCKNPKICFLEKLRKYPKICLNIFFLYAKISTNMRKKSKKSAKISKNLRKCLKIDENI